MVKAITNTSQLNFFDTWKTVLKSNSILKRKFTDSDFYEYEPREKSSSFNGYPFMSFVDRNTSTEGITTNRATTGKEFSVNFIMVNEYEARSKVTSYINEVIYAIESNESSFNNLGYDRVFIELVSSIPEIRESKEVITTTFELRFSGVVER